MNLGRSSLYAAFGAMIALCSGCTTATEKTARDACRIDPAVSAQPLLKVPFTVVDGRVYVDAKVNGKGPFRFAIDTGASGLARSDASLTSALDLPVRYDGKSSDALQTATVEVTRFDTLEIGGFIRRDVEAISRDYRSRANAAKDMSGIIARNFFADGLLVIDYPRRTLTFTRSISLSPGDLGALPYERPFRVPVSIGKERVEGNLDSGANVTMVVPKSLFDRFPASTLGPKVTGTLMNTSIDAQFATLPGPMQLGAVELTSIEVRVSEKFPELLIGAHILQNYRLIIDQRSKNVAICPPANG